MTNEDFEAEVIAGFERSSKVLIAKGKEYATPDGDRLSQFKIAAALVNKTPAETLLDMATKHFTSLMTMAKRPKMYNIELWREKTTDLRNYTFLLDALLLDIMEDK